MKVSFTKQSPHMAKSHGLSLHIIRMELSGFNTEPEQKLLSIRRVQPFTDNVLKIKQNIRQDHKFYSSFSYSHKILRFFDSNTILTSSMTSRIVTVNLFRIKVFFHMMFTSDSFICGGKCHRPWHYGRKHSSLNVMVH